MTILFKPAILIFECLSLPQKLMLITATSTLPLSAVLIYLIPILATIDENVSSNLILFVIISLVMSLYLLLAFNHYQQRTIAQLHDKQATTYQENEFNPVMLSIYQQQTAINRLREKNKSAHDEVYSAALDLAEMNSRSTDMMNTQQLSVANILRKMEQLSGNIEVVSAHADEAANTSKMADTHATEGEAVVEEMSAEIQLAADSINQSVEQINSLLARSKEISSIIDTIDEISNQTNLLALNAAIEAARAGEHGRGFSVVSDEVRHLAQRSQEAASRVSKQILSIQNDVQNVSNGMKLIISSINSSVELSVATKDALQEIKKGAQSTVDAMGNISLAINEQNEGSSEVSMHIEKINQMAIQTTEVINEASDTAHYLVSLSQSKNS